MDNAADLKIDLNAKDNQGLTAFHWVCLRGDTKLAKILVKNSKLDFSARDNSESTSFHYACRYAHSEIAELLIENHANLNIELDAKDNEGWTKDFRAFRVALVRRLTSAEFVFLFMVSNPYSYSDNFES